MQFVNINNHTIHYKHVTRAGFESSGLTFLFINSIGTDYRIWDSVANKLQAYSDVILYDQRGHGLSDVVEDETGLDGFVDDAQALLRYLGVGKCVVVGLSLGGMVAQSLALRIPGVVEKLILCDTCYKIGNAQRWNERIEVVGSKGIEAVADNSMRVWFSERYTERNAVRVSGYKNMLLRTPLRGYIKSCEALCDADLQEAIGGITAPTLCVVGEEDTSTTPEDVKKLADAITGAQYAVIENSAHVPCVDNAPALTKLIIDFIQS